MPDESFLLPRDIASKFDCIPYRHKTLGVSIVIPIRGADRNPHLFACINHLLLQNCEPIEIIVVEQDWRRNVDLGSYKNHPNIKHVFLQENEPFSRSRTGNCGVAHSSYNFVMIHDVDLLVEKHFLWEAYNLLWKYDIAFTIKEIHYLDHVPTDMHNYHYRDPSWTKRLDWSCHGGSVAFKKDKFIEIGGMNEAFKGYGSEDSEFYARALALCKTFDHRFTTMLHMTHPYKTVMADVKANLETLHQCEKRNIQELAAELKQKFHSNWLKD